MTDDRKHSNIIRGHFPPPDPPAGVRFGVGLRYDVEHRDDGPWLVVYVGDKRIGEVPIKPGTEPRIKYAKVLPMNRKREVSPPTSDHSRNTGTPSDS